MTGHFGLKGYRPWLHELRVLWTDDGARFYQSPRRRPGTPEQVELASRALEFLADTTDLEVKRQDAKANRLSLTGRARREFYLSEPLSYEWHQANQAAAGALDLISRWQEFRIRATL